MSTTPSASEPSEEDQKLLQHTWLPPRPEAPLQTDCCGTGCSPCVLDLHQRELQLWRDECHRLLRGEGGNDAAVITLTSWTHYRVEKITKEAVDAVRLRLALPPGCSLGLSPGQHVRLREGSSGYSRPYTPVSARAAVGYFDVVVKVYPEGRMSQYVARLTEGDTAQWKGPYGDFAYRRNQTSHLLLVGGGTGLAPMLQVLSSILEDEEDETVCHLVYAARSFDHVLCKRQLDACSDYWNCRVTYCLSQDSPDRSHTAKRSADNIHYSRVDKDWLLGLLPTGGASYRVLLCGPRDFESQVRDWLSGANVGSDQLFLF